VSPRGIRESAAAVAQMLYLGRTGEAEALFTAIEPLAARIEADDPAVRARVEQARSVAAMVAGDVGAHIDHARAAVLALEEAGDVRAACDEFAGLHQVTGGVDGQVSLEVSPTLAHDTRATIHEAERLWGAVDRPNAMIKIPGTEAGLPAITHCVAAGISVNVTLLFSVERYRAVIEAWLAGLEQRLAEGGDLGPVSSVASFFVSRVDGKVDPLLDRAGHDALRGRIAIANACAAYRLFEGSLGTPRWQRLAQAGARPQRPLWASTSTKDPAYPDTYYVEALVAADTVNTIPPDTLDAYRDHGKPELRIHEAMASAPRLLRQLAETGVDLEEVTRFLEGDGVAKFAASYRQLLAGIEAKASALVR